MTAEYQNSDSFRVKEYINSKYSVIDLLNENFDMDVTEGTTCCCPFHEDNRRSMKVFKDAAWCFAERIQFTPYKVLLEMGYTKEQLAAVVPDEYKVEQKQNVNDEALKLLPHARQHFIKTSSISDLVTIWNTCFSKNK